MQDEESFEDPLELNGKKPTTIWDAILSINDLIKALGLEILRSERETSVGKINCLMALFILMIFLLQALRTVFDVTIYTFLFLFITFIVVSVMMSNRSLRSKGAGELREEF